MRSYLNWMREQALPFWLSDGFDPARDRFHERLDAAGRPLPVAYRSMVQARQIFVYAHAARIGWLDRIAADVAVRAMASLRRDFEVREGGHTRFAFSIDPIDGQIVSDVSDAYAHAFVLFAAAELHALTGAPDLLDLADRVIAFLDHAMTDREHGGLHDALPLGASPTKRQNPQMHLLEAYLALDTTAPGRSYLDRASSIVDLFRTRLFSAEHGVLVEHFSPEWGDHADAALCHRFEPGHHFEWIWLLDRYEQRTGIAHQDHRDWLHAAAHGSGIAGNGLIYDELDCARRVTKASHRLWPHTEAIKAGAVVYEAGDTEGLAFAQTMVDGLTTHFLGRPFAGGWTDQIGPDLAPLVDHVPASSLYHLMLAASEAERVFDRAGDATT